MDYSAKALIISNRTLKNKINGRLFRILAILAEIKHTQTPKRNLRLAEMMATLEIQFFFSLSPEQNVSEQGCLLIAGHLLCTDMYNFAAYIFNDFKNNFLSSVSPPLACEMMRAYTTTGSRFP